MKTNTLSKIAIVLCVLAIMAMGWRRYNDWNTETKEQFSLHVLDKYTVWRDIDPQTKERVWVAQDKHGRKATSTIDPLFAIQDLERSRQTFQFSPEGGLEGGTGQ